MPGIFDKVKGTANSLAASAVEACGGGLDAARAILDDIGTAADDLERLGYTVRDIEVTVSLPPAVTVYLSRTGEPTAEGFQAALANRSSQSSAWLLIKLVQQADRMSANLRVAGRRCREVAIDLGLRPAIRFLFARDAAAT